MQPGPDRELDDDEILAVIALTRDRYAGTSELADYFDVTTEGIRTYLERLTDAGYLRTRTIGQTKTWTLTDTGEQHVSPLNPDPDPTS